MELAVNKRTIGLSLILLVLSLGAVSCSPVHSSPSESELSAKSRSPVDTDVFSALETGKSGVDGRSVAASDLSAASTRLLSKSSAQTVGIQLVESKNIAQLVVEANIAADTVSTVRLTNPERLVVDLPSIVGPKMRSATYDTQDSQFLSRIRVGAHPDKTRIVMDLPSNAPSITNTVESRNGALLVNIFQTPVAELGGDNTDLGNTDLGNADLAASEIVADEIKAAPKAELLESVKLEAEENTTANPKVVSSDSGITAPQNLPVLQALRFEEIGEKRNQLVLDMESAGVYSLKKTAPSEYLLKLEEASLSDSVEPVVVARPGSGKIRSVRISSKNDAAVLRIFAAPGVTLRAQSRAGGIVVGEDYKDSDFAADARAQFAPEEAPKSDTSAPAKKEAPAQAPVKTEEAANTTAAAGKTPGEDRELNALLADENYQGRLISLDLQDTDIDNALRIIAEVSNLNIVTTEDVAGKVTLRLIDVPWDQALDVILKINSLGKVQEGNVVRIAPLEKLRAEREALKQAKVAEEQLEELKVRYLRVSYARAGDLKPLVENVVSERGSVTYDERSNQLIIKDTKTGVNRVVELVRKLDLRTPQVLLETQIVESKRDFVRQLGAQLGFSFQNSPSTGNATGYNFPNSIEGSANSNNLGTLGESAPGFLNVLFGSADGTRSLDLQLAAAENEGLAKVVSRPSVATTNNKQATIKSVEKVRVKLPSGGNSVTVGQGAQGSGGSTATESIEAGIVLEVTPQASPDYYVLLDINAKSSSFTKTNNVEGIPSEIERSATSTILVSSGQTFVMGGIYKITENLGARGIPFLKDVPVLGHLFRFSDVTDTDEELLFFITPRIIEGSFDDAAMKAAM